MTGDEPDCQGSAIVLPQVGFEPFFGQVHSASSSFSQAK